MFIINNLNKIWHSSASRKNSSILARTHPPTALLDPKTKLIPSIGRQRSWVPMTPPSLAVFSSWTSTSQRITPSSHQSSSSLRKYTTPISTQTEVSVWTSWKTSGPLHSLFQRFSSQSVPCWPMPTRTIPLSPTSPTSTSPTEQSMKPLLVNGLVSTPCEHRSMWCHVLSTRWLLLEQETPHKKHRFRSAAGCENSDFDQPCV